ncbi:MAG: YitT family protein [Candidatus Edwardsbacteria bacterium]|nr:YitT family protein [Candidatus Edwardsbacteria bacterium]
MKRIIVKPKLPKVIWDFFMITLGAGCMALSYDLFLVPHKIAPGGAAGVATIFHYLFKLPVGAVIFVVNIPLFIWGLKEFGRKFGFRTIYAVFMTSFLTDFLQAAFHLQAATRNTILAAVYGAALLGIGLGLAFRHQATTGGSDIVAQIIAKYTNATPGIGIMIVDFGIIALAGLTFGQVDLALYGFITLYISTRILDVMLEGWSYNKAAYIISDNWELIRGEVVLGLDRGGTMWAGQGFYKGAEKTILFCVVSRKELAQLREAVKLLDPKAFMVVTDAKEVLGYGFKPWSKVTTN